MALSVQNIVSRVFILKVVQLLFVFIVFLLFRCGDSGDVLHWGRGTCSVSRERAENILVLGTATSSVFLFIVMVLMIAVSLGDKGDYTVPDNRVYMITINN